MIASPARKGPASRAPRTTDAPRRAGKEPRRAVAAERQNLLTQHVGLVHHVARQLARRLSTAAELDDLVSAGMLGLIQAADTFDASRGLSFSTHAVPRIRGAMLDELRKQDTLPRNVRRRTRDLARARELLTDTLRRSPTHDELATVMQVPADAVRRCELDAESAAPRSLDQPLRGEDVGSTLADLTIDERTPSIDDLLTHEQEVERLKVAIAGLKEQERIVLALNFFEELKLHEIAEVLQLSVCRISQIRTAALARLRVALSDLRAA